MQAHAAPHSTVAGATRERAGSRPVSRVRRYGIFGLSLAAYAGGAHLLGLPLEERWGEYLRSALVMVGAAAVPVFWTLIVTSWVLRRPFPFRSLPERLAGAVFFAIAVVWMFEAFTAWKASIPIFVAYGWDPLLADLDRILHLGRDAWRWTHALPGPVTSGLDWIYTTWYPVLGGTIALVCLWGDFRSRARFFLAFLFCWVVGGTLLATLFASGGPVYYGDLTGDPARYASLMGALEGTSARTIQDALWSSFVDPGTVRFEGISAMPSLHVAMGALLTLVAWKAHRWAGIVMGIYALLVFLGSVHLAWHYAIDGYVAVGVAVAGWKLADLLVGPGTGDDDATAPAGPGP